MSHPLAVDARLVELVSFAVALVSFAWAAYSYLVLRRWIRACRGIRIACARKGKVQLEAPLTDWLAWGRMLEKDQATRGRVVFHTGHASVALLRPAVAPKVAVVARRRLLLERAGRILRRRRPEEAAA